MRFFKPITTIFEDSLIIYRDILKQPPICLAKVTEKFCAAIYLLGLVVCEQNCIKFEINGIPNLPIISSRARHITINIFNSK